MRSSSRRIRTFLLLSLPLSLYVSASAQTRAGENSSPWSVIVTATLNPLPIPFCGAVRVDVTDPKTGGRPRNAAGALMGAADFDLSVTSPDPKAMVGQLNDPTNFMVCACMAGAVGAVGTITASYPANRLSAKARVPGVAFQTTSTVTLAAAKGNVEAVGCKAPIPPTVIAGAATPLPAAAKAPAVPKTTGGSAPPPTGVTVTGPPLTATVTWTAAPNATRYAVLRNDDANPAVEKSPPAFIATSFTEVLPDPRITYRYSVVAYYADGSWGASPTVQYISPPMVNPTGFTVSKRGQVGPTRATMDFSWNAVPGAVQYRLDGPGIVNTGHYVTTPNATLDLPRGAGSWTVAAVYPGNYGDFAKPSSVSAVIRVLPTPSKTWLTMPNGVGSQYSVQMPQSGRRMGYQNELQYPYDANYSEWLGREVVKGFWGLEVWLWNNSNYASMRLWDSPTAFAKEAVYGNPGDLGVGRRTDCTQETRAGSRPGIYTVCYAAAHGIPPGQPGFNDPQVITRPGEGQGADFILAMVITKDPQGSVFMVFRSGGDYLLSPSVTLDTQGPKFVPHACLSCHGGTYNPATHYVDGASLLPIDPNLQSFVNETEKAGQQETIRRINSMISQSGSSPAIRAYINGLYGNDVVTPGRIATVDFVPSGWQQQAGLYRQVVRPYCAMCHLAQTDLNFASWANLEASKVRVKLAVCSQHTMPHAEIQFKEFWTKDTGPVYLPGLLTSTLSLPGC